MLEHGRAEVQERQTSQDCLHPALLPLQAEQCQGPGDCPVSSEVPAQDQCGFSLVSLTPRTLSSHTHPSAVVLMLRTTSEKGLRITLQLGKLRLERNCSGSQMGQSRGQWCFL